MVMYVGPEGGWSEQDIERLKSAGARTYSFGERVMRTETAAIVAAYALQ